LHGNKAYGGNNHCRHERSNLHATIVARGGFSRSQAKEKLALCALDLRLLEFVGVLNFLAARNRVLRFGMFGFGFGHLKTAQTEQHGQ
jgi:hypothetical protein